MADASDPRATALEIYRIAWAEIRKHSASAGEVPGPEGYYLEDLKEALLDLKQAFLSADERGMRRYGDEVLMLLVEWREERLGE